MDALGATITDATAEWEAIPLQVFFKNGRVKFKYMWLEKGAKLKAPIEL